MASYTGILQGGTDKRRHKRYACSVPLEICAEKASLAAGATACDFSLGGLSFVSDRFHPKGHTLTVSISWDGGQEKVRAVVVYSNRVPALNMYRTGVRFFEEMDRLLFPAPADK